MHDAYFLQGVLLASTAEFLFAHDFDSDGVFGGHMVAPVFSTGFEGHAQLDLREGGREGGEEGREGW